MSSDDEEGDTVEPSVPLLSEPGFVAETPCYGFEEDEEEDNDEVEDDDNTPKQNHSLRENKRKRLTVSNRGNKSKKTLSFNHMSHHKQIVSPAREKKLFS